MYEETTKIPPQAVDLEEAVLGALLLEKDALMQVSDILRPEMFYKSAHEKIYRSILELDKKHEPVDILTVSKDLERRAVLTEIGGPSFIANLTSGIGSATNIEYHARIIVEKWILREVISIGSDAQKSGFEQPDVFNLVDGLVKRLENIVNFNSNDISAAGRMKKAREYFYRAYGSENGLGGLSTGYKTLDGKTGGLIPGDLIVGGGLPGAFKTALTISILHNVAKQGVPVLMFQQEMSDEQTGIREIAVQGGLHVGAIKRGNLSKSETQRFEEAITQLEDRPVYIDTSSGINTGYIRTLGRKYVKEKGVGLIVVDYLQLMEEEGKQTQEQAIDTTVKQLKILAKKLNIPIILLSAFNDNAYKDPTTPPKANSLKGSRAIGAHADIVFFLWNPSKDVPGFVFNDPVKGGINTDGKLGVIFDKNRQDSPGLVWLGVDPPTNTFFDLDNF